MNPASPLRPLAWRAVLCSAWSLAAVPPAWGQTNEQAAFSGAVGLASAQVLRGVSQSNGSASLSIDLNRRYDNGWALGASLATLGRDAQGDRYLLGLSANRHWQLDADWAVQAGAAHYAYPGSADRHRFDYDELSASIAWRGRWGASLAVLPNAVRRDAAGTPRRGRATALEVSVHEPLGGRLSLDAGIGWLDLSPIRGRGYAYGSIGLGWGVGPVQVFTSWIASQAADRGLAAPAAGGNRWVAAASWVF